MNRRILFLTAVLGLAGCDQPMTNDQIIAETKKCEDAGLDVSVGVDGWNWNITHITCVPKIPK